METNLTQNAQGTVTANNLTTAGGSSEPFDTQKAFAEILNKNTDLLNKTSEQSEQTEDTLERIKDPKPNESYSDFGNCWLYCFNCNGSSNSDWIYATFDYYIWHINRQAQFSYNASTLTKTPFNIKLKEIKNGLNNL